MFNNNTQKKVIKGEQLEIYTLGRFQVRLGGQILFNEVGRSQKIGELFMYLITHRGKSATPETILEALWPEQDYNNPKNAIKILVHRLKQKLETNGIPDARSSISCMYGCYGWNSSIPYWFDAVEFESLCQEARSLAKTDPLQSAEKYREALALYQGDYLPECRYSDWVLPARHYYKRLYVSCTTELLALQKEHRLYSQMLEDCEKAFFIERFDENLHLRFIEALLEEGKISQARAHYEYITSIVYQELGVKPSPSLRDIYRTIKVQNKTPELQDLLTEQDSTRGALICDPETFRFVCRVERRRASREEAPVQLGVLSFTGTDFLPPPPPQLQQSMDRLKQILRASLRGGDVISPWSENQFTLLLPRISLQQAENVLQRVSKLFNKAGSPERIMLQCSAHPFLPLDYA